MHSLFLLTIGIYGSAKLLSQSEILSPLKEISVSLNQSCSVMCFLFKQARKTCEI